MRDDLFVSVRVSDGEDLLCGNRIDRAVRIVPFLVFDLHVGYFQHFSLDLRRIFFLDDVLCADSLHEKCRGKYEYQAFHRKFSFELNNEWCCLTGI